MKHIKIRVEAVIKNKKDQILLARHEKKGHSYWVLPGGGVDFGESMETALARELQEELGLINVNVSQLLYTNTFIPLDKSRHVVMMGYQVQVDAQELEDVRVITADEAIKGIRFFSTGEITDSADTFYPDKEFLQELLGLMIG